MPVMDVLSKPQPVAGGRDQPLQLGGVAVDAPFYQAGLAGYSDGAMRMVAREHGCPYCITEAMLDQFLIAGGKGLKAAEIPPGDHPIAGQLMGSHPADIAAGADILVDLGYDVVDVNLACPVKKIKKKCRGGHLLCVPEEATAILEAVREAMDRRADGGVPLTVKLRRAYDDTPEMARAFETVFEAAMELGYAGATVHCRTVQQKYVGRGRWPFFARVDPALRDGGEAAGLRDRGQRGHLDGGGYFSDARRDRGGLGECGPGVHRESVGVCAGAGADGGAGGGRDGDGGGRGAVGVGAAGGAAAAF